MSTDIYSTWRNRVDRPSDIRGRKEGTGAVCCNPTCGAASDHRNGLQVCGNCKTHAYCSRECQVAHWSLHKSYCIPYNVTRLGNNFLTSEVLDFCVSLLCILDLDLLNADPNKFLHYGLLFLIAPEEERKSGHRIKPRNGRDVTGDTGVLFLRSTFVRPDGWDGATPPVMQRLESIRKEVERDNEDLRVLLLERQGIGARSTVVTVYKTHPKAMESVRKHRENGTRLPFGLKRLDSNFIFHFMNDYIIRDTKNQMKFRTKMNENNVRALHGVLAKEDPKSTSK